MWIKWKGTGKELLFLYLQTDRQYWKNNDNKMLWFKEILFGMLLLLTLLKRQNGCTSLKIRGANSEVISALIVQLLITLLSVKSSAFQQQKSQQASFQWKPLLSEFHRIQLAIHTYAVLCWHIQILHGSTKTLCLAIAKLFIASIPASYDWTQLTTVPRCREIFANFRNIILSACPFQGFLL